jgi:putative methylase
MGEPAQRRLIRKLDLERFLTQVKPNPAPKVSLEQYTLSESAAASMLYLAAYTYGDIVGKRVLDLGCGTGRLALGAAFLGAESVVGVDIDAETLTVAVQNSAEADLKGAVDWVIGDIDAVIGKFDTVVQNPPFGVQKRAADRRFLEKALEVGCSVYSLHNHPLHDRTLLSRIKANRGQLIQVEASPFLVRLAEVQGGRVEAVYALPLVIPHMFDFHTREKQDIIIDLYVVRKSK